MRVSQFKGDTAKAIAIAYFTSLGYEVGLLITESAPYDLIVDAGTLHKVQVKYVTISDKNRYGVDLRRIHSNSKGYVVKQYGESDFDWLFIYTSKGDIYLLSDVSGKSRVSLYNRKPDFRFINPRTDAGDWFNGALLKSEGGDEPPVGSNPTLSATNSCLGCGREKLSYEICCM